MEGPQELSTRKLDAKTRALFTAAKSADLETVKSLICGGADPVATQSNKCEPNILHILYERLKRCVNKHRVLHIIEYVLSLPQFQKRSCKSVPVYREILLHMARNSFCNFKMVSLMLNLILKLNFINDLVFKRRITHRILNQRSFIIRMNIAALFVYEVMNDKKRPVSTSEKLTKFLLSLVDIGFSMKESEGCVTVLTVYVLQLRLTHIKPNQLVFKREIVNKFIEDGVNVESSTILSKYPAHIRWHYHQSKFMLPDVIFVSYMNKMRKLFSIFLPYWWAPPATLYAIRYKRQIFGENCCFPYTYFCQFTSYGGVPHGTDMFHHSIRGMRNIIQNSQHWQTLDHKRRNLHQQMKVSYKKLKKSPLRLTDLAKYAVRQALSTRAAQPDTNLPKLLREVLPEDMHTLAEYVRME